MIFFLPRGCMIFFCAKSWLDFFCAERLLYFFLLRGCVIFLDGCVMFSCDKRLHFFLSGEVA